MDVSGDGPVVTSIVLTYRHEADVAQALTSVLAQQFSGRHQILVVDDASPDGTLAAVAEVIALHPGAPVEVLAGTRNVGMQRNLRRALEAAEGTYVAWLEGDDVWTEPDKLEAQVAYLEGRPEAVAVGHLTRVLLGDEPSGLLVGGGFGGSAVIEPADVWAGGYPHLSSLLHRRTALPTTPAWFDDLAAADWPMVVLLAQQGPIGLIRREMSDYRKNLRSSWTPRPQIERKLLGLAIVDAVRRQGGVDGPELRAEHARLHLTVAVLARGERRVGLAVRHLASAVVLDPRGLLRRLRDRARRSQLD